MKIRKVSPEEADKLFVESFLTPSMKARLTAYRNWMTYQRGERVRQAGKRVILREAEGDG